MAKVITVMNMKGGVGKTTVALHVGGFLGRFEVNGRRRKVLMIDYDPQFNLSQAYVPPIAYFSLEKERKTTLAILLDDEVALDPYKLQVPGNEQPPAVSQLAFPIYAHKGGKSRLDLVPSSLDLMYVALGQTDHHTRPIEERFEKFIAEAREKYDLIVIDCHPAGSIFTKTSLRNSDHVLIPVMPQRYAIRGIGLMMQFIGDKGAGKSSPIPHILFNHTWRSGVSAEEAQIRGNPRYAKYCLAQTLKYYKAFSEPEDGEGFVWFSSKPYSTEAFHNLQGVVSEFAQRIGA